MSDTPESNKAKIAFTSLFANDDAYWVPFKVSCKLERELTDATEQRDRLAEAAQAVVDRWETPFWKQVEHTGVFIAALRKAVEQVKGVQP